MKRLSPFLALIALVSVCFTLATVLATRAAGWNRRTQGNVFTFLFGDGRRLFANHFFTVADVYFHSGYYPSIFDQRQQPGEKAIVTGHSDHHDDEEEHEKQMDFLGPPRDWIERFGRRFRITEHKHLEEGQEREILPWLRLSADLDPQRVDTYTVAAYWLRSHLNKPDDAEAFLREGLRNNPNSYEILFELGNLYYETRHDFGRARNVWKLALRRWQQQDENARQSTFLALDKIAMNLGRLEEESGNFDRSIEYFELARAVSPRPEAVQKHIDEVRQKQSGGSPSTRGEP